MPARYKDWRVKYLAPLLRGEKVSPAYSDVEPVHEQVERERMIRLLIYFKAQGLKGTPEGVDTKEWNEWQKALETIQSWDNNYKG